MIGERPSSGADAGADTGEARELARARAGDVAAFGALVRRHQERVFRFLHRMLDAREEAMELTQDVFVKAWQALPGWRPEAASPPGCCRSRATRRSTSCVAAGGALRAAGGRPGGRRRAPGPEARYASRQRQAQLERRCGGSPPSTARSCCCARSRAWPTASWRASSALPRAR